MSEFSYKILSPSFTSSLEIDRSELFCDFFEISSNREIRHLVIHHIEAKNSSEAIKMLKEHQVSAHFLIDENGKIFNLVDEQNIAHHAGRSYWRGEFGLNKTSLGIEFINSKAFEKNFSDKQLISGLNLVIHLLKKYKIELQNVVGHSDIAFNPQNLFLDRKQDPSHLFDWRFFAANKAAIAYLGKTIIEYYNIAEEQASSQKQLKNHLLIQPNKLLNLLNQNLKFFELQFQSGNSSIDIIKIKKDLNRFGYLINNFDENFDEEMKFVVRVFNRRFFPESYKRESGLDAWYHGSQVILFYLNSFLSEFLLTTS